jgi:hypothetical protein
MLSLNVAQPIPNEYPLVNPGTRWLIRVIVKFNQLSKVGILRIVVQQGDGPFFEAFFCIGFVPSPAFVPIDRPQIA